MEATQWDDSEQTPLASIISGLEEIIANQAHRPNMLIMGPQQYAAYKYMVNTETIVEWPGYERKLGPDGKTWLERKRELRDHYFWAWGHGNKAKRRIGMDPDRIRAYMESGYGDLARHEAYAPWEAAPTR